MAITKEKKKEIYEGVNKAVSEAGSVVFVNFHGLSVLETTNLRKGLREEGVGYTVAKKTIIKKSLTDSKIEGEIPSLDGELAIAHGEDLIAPARGINDFKKTHKDSIDILGGVFEGKFMNKEEMMEIATIPPVPVLRGMFVNVINSSIQGLVVSLSKIAETKEA